MPSSRRRLQNEALVDHDRHLLQAGQLGRPQPALAGDQFVALGPLPNQERLQDPVLADRLGQLLQGRRLEGAPGLVWIGPDRSDRDLQGSGRPGAAARLIEVIPGRDQRFQPATESTTPVHVAISSLVSSW